MSSSFLGHGVGTTALPRADPALCLSGYLVQQEAFAVGTAAMAADLVAAPPQQAAPGVQQAAPATQHAPALPALPVFAAAGEVVAALPSCTQTVALPRVTKRPWVPRSAAAAGFGARAVRVMGAQQLSVWGAGCAERATDGAATVTAAATNDKARVFLVKRKLIVFS
jgi:hypothetical protein